MKVTCGSLVMMKGKINGNLYTLMGEIVLGSAAIGDSTVESDKMRLWHMCLGHMTEKGLMILGQLGMLKGMEKPSMEFCEDCIYRKQCRVQFYTSKSKSRNILDYVQSDVWGPTKHASKGGSRYYVSFIDDYSRYTWVYFLKTKDQVFEKFKEWKALVENRTGRKVKTFRLDNDTEYNTGPFLQFCS